MTFFIFVAAAHSHDHGGHSHGAHQETEDSHHDALHSHEHTTSSAIGELFSLSNTNALLI